MKINLKVVTLSMIYLWYDEIDDTIMCMFIILASICEIVEQFKHLGICSYMP